MVGVNEAIVIVLNIAALIASILVLYYYKKTKLTDFLIYSWFFFQAFVTTAILIFALSNDILILYQLHWISMSTQYVLFFRHISKLVYDKTPKALNIIGYGFYLLIVIIIAFWKKMEQPMIGTQLFIFKGDHNQSSYFPLGGGLEYDNTIILSSAYQGLMAIYFVLITTFGVYAYAKIQLVNSTPRTRRAKKLWILTYIFFFLFSALRLPYITEINSEWNYLYGNVFATIGMALAIFTILTIPEAVLLSQVQVVRACSLYKMVHVYEDKNSLNTMGLNRIYDYIKLISDDVFLESCKESPLEAEVK